MLASFLLIVSLSQDTATPTPFLWLIEGMGDPKKPILVTISLTPVGLGNGIEVETISLGPLPTPDDPKPGVIRPLKTEPAPEMSQQRGRGLRAWFTPPGRRFHLMVSFKRIDSQDRYLPDRPGVRTEGKTAPTDCADSSRNVGDTRVLRPDQN